MTNRLLLKTYRYQSTLSLISKNRYKFKINCDKLIQVNNALRKTENLQVLLDHTTISQKYLTNYLGMLSFRFF